MLVSVRLVTVAKTESQRLLEMNIFAVFRAVLPVQ